MKNIEFTDEELAFAKQNRIKCTLNTETTALLIRSAKIECERVFGSFRPGKIPNTIHRWSIQHILKQVCSQYLESDCKYMPDAIGSAPQKAEPESNIIEFVNEAEEEPQEPPAADECDDEPAPYRPPSYYLRKLRKKASEEAFSYRRANQIVDIMAEDIENLHDQFKRWDYSPPRLWDWGEVYKSCFPDECPGNETSSWVFDSGRIKWDYRDREAVQ